MATLNFNAADIEPAAPISALPPGRYPVAISKTEMKDTKAGTGQYLQIELTITSGTAANRKLWARLNLVNQNQQAVDIAYRELSAICHAVGVLQVADFHPHYQFGGTEVDDIENFTNRSPYPTLHLLREASMDKAVEAYPDASLIFERNIEVLNKLGHAEWAALGIAARLHN